MAESVATTDRLAIICVFMGFEMPGLLTEAFLTAHLTLVKSLVSVFHQIELKRSVVNPDPALIPDNPPLVSAFA